MKRFILMACLLVPGLVHAAAPDQVFDAPQVVAVEPRAYNPHYDVTGMLSILPLDAFYKGFAAGVSYTQSYTSSWSWEIINANYSSKSDTSLKNDLMENWKVRPQGLLEHITWYASTSAIYTPIYSKNLLFNSSLLYGSFSFVGSGGMVNFSGGETVPMIGTGLILRAFHSERMSSKLDMRVHYHMSKGRSSDLIMVIAYGLSFELGDNKPWN
ncbi:MAG: hypothetical protein KF802_03715 [Bdellovibrionaceae bacterium]|nr:hypothetical protein [Pseudobdellovibrionaceae bacterium]MBX3033270.1 hypothetical protein [Pseudobdellovibrionaceae bacterium]